MFGRYNKTVIEKIMEKKQKENLIMKTKKILALALGAVCVFGMLAGCGKQETGTV